MTYRIVDEPRPDSARRFVVNPFWPLVSVMLAGAWLAWPWFLWNAFALGTPTRRKEAALCAGGFLVTALLAVVLIKLADDEVLMGAALRYAALSLSIWKLGLAYWLHALQGRTFQLHQHFGNPVRNGLYVAIAGVVVGRPLVVGLIDHVLWRIVVGS